MELPYAVTWTPPNRSIPLGNDEPRRGDSVIPIDPRTSRDMASAGMPVTEACMWIHIYYSILSSFVHCGVDPAHVAVSRKIMNLLRNFVSTRNQKADGRPKLLPWSVTFQSDPVLDWLISSS